MDSIDFQALDEARFNPRPGFPKGHTIAQMCQEIDITVDTYHKLKRGKHSPRPRTLAAFNRYIKASKRK